MLDKAMGSLGLTFYTTNEAHVPHLLAWPLLLLLTSFNPPPCASSMRGLFMCGLTVVVIPSAGAAPAREEYNDYTEFFEVLGITDATKVSYLSTLLRHFYEAAVKLDGLLAPHGACLHSAVSRMYSSGNPHEPPRHRWIRVVDRLGVFTEKDAHAQRIVNVGLSFAYRHLELNELTEDNAPLLSRSRAPTGSRADGVVQAGDANVPNGGVVVYQRPDAGTASGPGGNPGSSAAGAASHATTTAGLNPAQGYAQVDEKLAPPGGMVVRGNAALTPTASASVGHLLSTASQELGHTGARNGVVNEGGLVVIDRLRPQVLSANGGQGSGATAMRSEGLPMATPRTRGAEGKAADDGGGGSSTGSTGNGDTTLLQGQSLGEGDDGGTLDEEEAVGVTTKIHLERPTIQPTAVAVDFVLAAVDSLTATDDGTEVMRTLPMDSLLTAARLRQERLPRRVKRKKGWLAVVAMLK